MGSVVQGQHAIPDVQHQQCLYLQIKIPCELYIQATLQDSDSCLRYVALSLPLPTPDSFWPLANANWYFQVCESKLQSRTYKKPR